MNSKFCRAVCVLTAFVLWTAAIRFVDVQPIGPQGSAVGFSAINRFFHELTGVHRTLYTITDWLGLVPIGFAAGFAVLGLIQWIQRNRLSRVDRSILLLGGFYVVVMVAYALFERLVINYRPVLIEGILEPSYPSSTTMLVLCVMPTAMTQLNTRVKNRRWRQFISVSICAFMVFMVIGRLLSGVHWLTDILGGVLLSAGLVLLYDAACQSR